MKKRLNPIVKDVLEKFDSIYSTTKSFASDEEVATKGLLISGDAGTGKTHWVRKALAEVTEPENIQYIKGSSITSPVVFVKLWLSRSPGQIIVFDDVDIIHKTGAELSTILDLFKGATEMDYGERIIAWERAGMNQLMVELGVPRQFDFQGSIIWITNDSINDIAKKAKGHWKAINSRFTTQKINLDDKEKLLYTLYLLEEMDMLGKDCRAKRGGYKRATINKTYDYLNDKYKLLIEVTPRIAIKIADMIESQPDKWETMLAQQLLRDI